MLNKLLASALIFTCAASASAEIRFSYSYDHNKHTAVLIRHTGDKADSPTVYVPQQVSYGAPTTMYDVVGIEADAVNDIAGMVTLVIPTTVKYIGQVNSRADVVRGADLKNFRNCPDMKRFVVTEGNTVFKATGAGILTTADSKTVLRVPQKLDLASTNGELKMSTTGVNIGIHAFEGNSTVRKIVFSKDLNSIHMEAGFSTMPQLESFSFPSGGAADGKFMIDNGAIINKTDKRLLFYPPGATADTYIITPANVTDVAQDAFANTVNLKTLIVPEGVKTFQAYAFRNSSVTDVTLPSSLNFRTLNGRGAFAGSKVTDLKWTTTPETYIPADFMLGCTSLKSFVCTTAPSHIGASAFRDCTSLQTFAPFDGNIRLTGDSVWANTGLKEVVFVQSERTSKLSMEFFNTFTGCRNLTKIDMRNFYVPTSTPRVVIGTGFASDCPELKEVYFPNYTEFQPRAISGCPKLDKIMVRQFEVTEAPAIQYATSTIAMPAIYVMVPENGAGYYNQPVDLLLGNSLNGDLKAIFYFETIYPMLGKYFPGSVNYIPANMLSRYPTPTDGAIAEEMFTFSIKQEGGMIHMNFKSLDFVDLHYICLNSGQRFDIPSDGHVYFPDSEKGMDLIEVHLSVNGVPMMMYYPQNLQPWDSMSGVTEVSSGSTLRFDGHSISTDSDSVIDIYDLTGRCIFSAEGPLADLSSLTGGTYIARLRGDSAQALKFIML